MSSKQDATNMTVALFGIITFVIVLFVKTIIEVVGWCIKTDKQKQTKTNKHDN
jgi:hypothetical protein